MQNTGKRDIRQTTLGLSALLLPAVLIAATASGAFAIGRPSARPPQPLILDMVHHNPDEPPYKSKFNDPEYTKSYGYNGKVYFLFDSPTLAIDWNTLDLDKDVLPEGSDARKWVSKKADSIHAKLKACRGAGLNTYALCDMILFPKRLIEEYGIEESFGNPRDPLTRKLLKTQIAESFAQFPELDGLVVRIGETYLQDAPYHKGEIDNKSDAEKTIIPLVQLLRQEICVKQGKTLIFRTWRSFDLSGEKYLQVSQAVEPHPKLFFSMKFCEGDFHRATRFTRSIGKGRHKQIIEVQCAREYEGKGAYPNYIAHGVIEGFEEYDRMPEEKINSLREFVEKKPELYGGVWTWSRGGGWRGPYPTNEMWCELNAWVMAQWASDTDKSEEAIFNEYAREHLGLADEDLEQFRRLCLLSAAAVVRGCNSTHNDMNPWWTRDAGIGWPKYRKHADIVRNLKQKDKSVEMWREIVGLADEIDWQDKETAAFARSSARYGLHLFRIYRALFYIDAVVNKREMPADVKTDLRTWIARYDQSWADYRALRDKYPKSLSTLYKQEFDFHIRDRADKRVDELRRGLEE